MLEVCTKHECAHNGNCEACNLEAENEKLRADFEDAQATNAQLLQALSLKGDYEIRENRR